MKALFNLHTNLCGENALMSDYRAMLDWFVHQGYDVEGFSGNTPVLITLINQWISYRDNLKNINQYDRSFIESEALKHACADDIYELRNSIEEMSDGQLMAIGRLFTQPVTFIDSPLQPSLRYVVYQNKPPTTEEVNIEWQKSATTKQQAFQKLLNRSPKQLQQLINGEWIDIPCVELTRP